MRRAAAIALLCLCACPSPNDAQRHAVESMGFTDVRILDEWPWFQCGEDDYVNASFVATNPAGKRVRGVVCCGATKACTVRF